MRVAMAWGMALGLLTLESVAGQFTSHSVAALDVTLALVAYLALKALPLEGAVTAFGVGYLVDVMSGRPSGLYTFLAELAYVGGKLGSSLVVVNTRHRFALFCMAVQAGHAVVAWMLRSAVARDPVGTAPLGLLPLQVLLTGAAALGLYGALRMLDPGEERARQDLVR